MPTLDGLECELHLRSEKCTEYAPPTGDPADPCPRTQTTYIQSNAGEKFEILIRATDEFRRTHPTVTGISIDLVLDGERYMLGCQTNLQCAGEESDPWDGIVLPDAGCVLPFRFTKRDVTDEKKKARKRVDSEALGTITVEVFRFHKSYESYYTSTSSGTAGRISDNELDAADKPVHEKDLKGKDLSHAAELGDSEAMTHYPRTLVHGSLCDDPDRPWMRFVFKYRSRHALRVLGLISEPPTPLRTRMDRFAAFSREELIRILLFYQERTAPRVKREASEEATSDRTKRRAGRPRKKLKSNMKMIDLTDD